VFPFVFPSVADVRITHLCHNICIVRLIRTESATCCSSLLYIIRNFIRVTILIIISMSWQNKFEIP
jgi:hypothetical protein